MAQKAIREVDAKVLLHRYFREKGKHALLGPRRLVPVDAKTDPLALAGENPWLKDSQLVAKPDQLIKRRGKHGLVALDKTYDEALSWIKRFMNKRIDVNGIEGRLEHFMIEPFVPHKQQDEYYVCIQMNRSGDEILFTHEGGMDVGDVEAKAKRLVVNKEVTEETIAGKLLDKVPAGRQQKIAAFIKTLYDCFRDYHFTYLEVNPFVCSGNKVIPLDVAAKVDDTAAFLCSEQWGKLDFPSGFGQTLTAEEQKVREMDARTGASLKFTLLNPDGRVWMMIAGGGASVVFADTVTDTGYGKDLANYGEYSGDPDEDMTYDYACTVLDLMTRKKHPEGKVLLIGGGIANFTDVAKTFKGIIRAIRTYERKLKEHKVRIYVRRAGPNYREGLDNMKSIEKELNIPVDVYGPETHMTRIVGFATQTL